MLKKQQNFGVYVIEVDNLQQRLQVPKSMINYAQFKQKVLEVALKEINEKTNLKFNYEVAEKIGRKISKIKFNIEKGE